MKMGDIWMDLLLKYPLIDVQNRDKTVYRGHIHAGGKDYPLIMTRKSRQGFVHYKLKSDLGPEIRKLVQMSKQVNVIEVMDTIKAALDSTHGHKIEKNWANIYKRVLYEYGEFTRFHLNVKLCRLATDLSKIHLTTLDEARREHSLDVVVNFDDTLNIFKPTNVDLPDQFKKDLCKPTGSLTGAYDQFLSILESLQPFFNLMDSLDESCGVVDPGTPTRKDCYRRIYIDENLSVVITIDPQNVSARPDLKFLGPDRLVEKYRRRLNEKLEDWDQSAGVLVGILDILELKEFPAKPALDAEMLTSAGECSICFSHRFNDKVPEIVCPNKSCENYYHNECLYEWLTSVHSKRIFSLIHGQCPNCEKGISCTVPDSEPPT